jgi:putative ABC transport system permease protein
VRSQLTYALRRLRGTGFFGVAVVVSLALSIGACTAVFAVVKASVFPTIPYREPDRLVEIWSTQNPRATQRIDAVPGERLRLWLGTRFESIGGFAARATLPLVLEGDAPERIEAEVVSGSYFGTMGVPTLLGRTLLPEDDRPGAEPAVVLSESIWRERFGAERSVLRRTLALSGRVYAIVGVMPASMREEPGVWVPAGEFLAQGVVAAWFPVARIEPGASIETVNLELRQRAAAEFASDSTRFGGMGAVAIRMNEAVSGANEPLLWALSGTAGALFLLALTNLSMLFLVRTAERGRATAVRLTLGASSWQLGRGLVLESLTLAGVGAGLGLIVASWLQELLRQTLGDLVAGPSGPSIDLVAFAFAAALALLAGMLVGLEPMRHIRRLDLRALLAGGIATTLGAGERRTRNVMLAAQVALTMVLASLGVTFAAAYSRFAGIDVGFDAERVVAAHPDYALTGATDEEQRELARAAVTSLPGQPGIEAATSWRMSIQSYPPPGETNAIFENGATSYPPRSGLYRFYDVGPGFLNALGIPLVAGRDFGPGDRLGSPAVGIVSEGGARVWWPRQDPIGRRLKLGTEGEWITVVGVTRDVAQLHEAGRAFSVGTVTSGSAQLPVLFRPAAQGDLLAPGWSHRGTIIGLDGFVIAARATDEGGDAADAVKQTLAGLEPTLPLRFLGSLHAWQMNTAYLLRLSRGLVGSVAAAGLLVSLLGISGAVNEAVVRRTREIGIRKTLGARAHHVTLTLVRESVTTSLAGLAIGMAAIYAMSRVPYVASRQFQSFLIGTSVADATALAWIGSALVLLATSVALLRAARAAGRLMRPTCHVGRAPLVGLTLAAALLTGCDRPARDEAPDVAGAPDVSPAPDSAAITASPIDAALARWEARLPDSLRHRHGACPFECCVYRTWRGTGEVPLRDAPERPAPITFRIPAGEPFNADSGFVRITGVSVLAVEESVNAGPTTFAPGDTLVVLDYVGEGFFNVWDSERVWQVSGFWGAEVGDPKASLVGGDRYAREWWVHASTGGGRKGWLDADSVARIQGVDACGQ